VILEKGDFVTDYECYTYISLEQEKGEECLMKIREFVKRKPKLSYVLDLIILIVCLWVLPNYILKSHPIWSLIVSFLIAIVVSSILGAKWQPWKLTK